MTRSGVRAVVWDWNGTLLDDVDRCRRTMNGTLSAFGASAIDSEEEYRALFRFPLRDFYRDAGVSEADYRPAVDHYLAALAADRSDVPLHPAARETIADLRRRGLIQVLASATLAPLLSDQLAAHALAPEFDEVLAIEDPHDASKYEVIRGWIDRSGIRADDVLMIGDTNHDADIAHALGAHFVHFTRGHQALTPRSEMMQIDDLRALPALLA